MKPIILSGLFLFCCFSGAALFAQEDGDEGGGGDDQAPIESRWQGTFFDTFSKGDGVFNINIGAIFPALFSRGSPSQFSPPVGGTLSLSGSYFLTSRLFLGGGVYGMFMPTIGKNMLYIVPMGPHIGVVWTFKRFELPLSLMAGWAWQTYANELYFGPIARPQAALLFRAFSSWSFGAAVSWWFVPEIGTKTRGSQEPHDVIGNFVDVTLMAQYHF